MCYSDPPFTPLLCEVPHDLKTLLSEFETIFGENHLHHTLSFRSFMPLLLVTEGIMFSGCFPIHMNVSLLLLITSYINMFLVLIQEIMH